MAFNGSGTFNRIYNWATDLSNSIAVTASRMDDEQDGIATGLSTCITKDGQTTITANIPFNSKKITGLGNGSARTDSIALGQVQDNTYEYLGENGGSADAYTFTPSPALTAYAAGQKWVILIGSGDGNTGASTFNISAVGSRDLKKSDGAGSTTALVSGDLAAGSLYEVVDNGTEGVVQNPELPIVDSLTINKKFNTQENTATISSGAITYTGAHMIIDTEASASTDDLDTINGGTDGDKLLLRIASSSREVVLKDGTGNLQFAKNGDITLGFTIDAIELIFDGTSWLAVNRLDGDLTGSPVQTVNTQTGTATTGTTIIPDDDTIPQNTEGDEYMTLSITPTNASNKLLIQAHGFFSNSGGGNIFSMALFQDSTSDAIAVTGQQMTTNNYPISLSMNHYMTAGTTSSTTFKIRAGSDLAGTTTFNGESGGRRYGGVIASSITITEIRV